MVTAEGRCHMDSAALQLPLELKAPTADGGLPSLALQNDLKIIKNFCLFFCTPVSILKCMVGKPIFETNLFQNKWGHNIS